MNTLTADEVKMIVESPNNDLKYDLAIMRAIRDRLNIPLLQAKDLLDKYKVALGRAVKVDCSACRGRGYFVVKESTYSDFENRYYPQKPFSKD
jgi:hypothetical protein